MSPHRASADALAARAAARRPPGRPLGGRGRPRAGRRSSPRTGSASSRCRSARTLGWFSPAERARRAARGFSPVALAAAGRAELRDPRRHLVRRRRRRLRRPGETRRAGSTTASSTAYGRLHELGWAHSVEAWDDEGLAGGVYGVAIGGLFAAESMFYARTDASKAAFVGLVELLRAAGTRTTGCSTSSG